MTARSWLYDGSPWLGLPARRSEWLRYKRSGGIVAVPDVAEFLHRVETGRWPEHAATRDTKAGPVVLRHPDGRPVRPLLDRLRDVWRQRARSIR